MADTTADKKKPFGFEVNYELFNTRGERLRERLLIENPGAAQVLMLGIVNALVKENERITLNPREQADSTNHHFRLRFAANTLARRSVGVEGEDWVSSRVDNSDGSTEIFLSWRSPAVTLQPGEWLSVGLKGVSAQPEAGAQVVMELKWPKPTIEKDPTAALTIELNGPGQGGEYELEAQRPLGTLNRQGRPDNPLRVGFVGNNQVLNVDNAQGTLRLRLSNEAPVGSQEGTLRFMYDTNSLTRTSRLVVALPVGTVADAPWALGTEQQVKDITFSTLPDWSRSAATLSADKTRLEWTFTPTKEVTLAPRAAWELQLGKLVTQHPDGPTELVVRCENVPGYWDGERVCVIEKAPLVFGQKVDASHDYSGHVGVGNPNPTVRFYLQGGHLRANNADIQHEKSFVFRSDMAKTGDFDAARFLKHDETTPLMALRSNGRLELSTTENGDGFIHSSRASSVRLGTRIDGSGAWFGALSNDSLKFFTNGGIVLMTLAKDGLVSIRERIKDKTGWLVPVGTIVCFGGDTAPEGWLKCDGRIYKRADYADLYAVVKDHYKTDGDNPLPGATEFRVPTLQGRVPVGFQPTAFPLGAMAGAMMHKLEVSEMPHHTHGVLDDGHFHQFTATNAEGRGGSVVPNRDADNGIVWHSTDSVKTGVRVEGAGGNVAHNNMQPYTVVNFIIKY
ncbi:phage tail protein [Archangium primigenium]|uniref:phage tail protein n=1 Tax=[Archangium] primigenium TaxID=2792470 RepID=UPI00195DF914|nr:tail fiber protein [Archangium primigenium]MBM7116090.1 tail fiber protein [Archangium primigenium]